MSRPSLPRHPTWIAAFVGAAVLASAATWARGAGLGASSDAAGNVTFRVYSATATRLEVWIYADPLGQPEKLALPMDGDPSSHVWSRTVGATDLRAAGIRGTVFYGYRAWGPNWPFVPSWKKGTADGFLADVDGNGNRFNPNKLLLDPYAREVSHDPRNATMPDGSVYRSGPVHRDQDTGSVAPKGVVIAADGEDVGPRPRRSLKDEVIYEVHLRGLTRNAPSIPAAERGTYAGAARKADGSGVDLIAEPYGARGVGTFQLGNFPFGWAEWDDRYRYPIRRKQNKLGIGGNEVSPAQLITLFAGSSDIYQPSGRKPYDGINYLVAHDGFTLRDLYSFLHKRNDQPFPLGPSPGGADDGGNISWDQGGVPALQRQAARTGLALLLTSAGVPMLVGGDEMYRTEFGNNNPFNLDNDAFYLDYGLRKAFPHHATYAKAMIRFRRDHPALRRSEFFDGRDHNGNGLKDVTWIRDNGQEADAGYLDNPANDFIAFRIDGTEAADPSSSILVAYNGFTGDIPLRLPANLPGNRWNLVADTAASLEGRDNLASPPSPVGASTYKTAARSVAVFIEQP